MRGLMRASARGSVGSARGLRAGGAAVLGLLALAAGSPGQSPPDAAPAQARAVQAGQAVSLDRALLDQFVAMRAGDGTKPVYWYCAGEMRGFPDGRVIARLEGLGADRLVPGEGGSPVATQLHREIFLYRDARTGEVIREVGGKPLRPLTMPYQLITYRMGDGGAEIFVEQGAGPALARLGPLEVTARRLPGGPVFSRPCSSSARAPLLPATTTPTTPRGSTA